MSKPVGADVVLGVGPPSFGGDVKPSVPSVVTLKPCVGVGMHVKEPRPELKVWLMSSPGVLAKLGAEQGFQPSERPLW